LTDGTAYHRGAPLDRYALAWRTTQRWVHQRIDQVLAKITGAVTAPGALQALRAVEDAQAALERLPRRPRPARN
jgi:hypothetical protein